VFSGDVRLLYLGALAPHARAAYAAQLSVLRISNLTGGLPTSPCVGSLQTQQDLLLYRHIRHSPRPRQQWRGILFLEFVELAETVLHALKVITINFSKPGRQSSKVDGPRLVKTGKHIFALLPERHIPAPFAYLSCRRNDKIKAMGKLFQYNHRARE